ncbi:MAG: ABC transporter ATP-binding protein [Thermodesulfobacteriota bacterium]
MAEPILEAKDVTRRFGGLVAVNQVSFAAERGEILGIIGPNGAGKTTLFNLLSGFLRLSQGEVLYQGERINSLKPHSIARKGLVRTFQQSNIYRTETVLSNVTLACHLSDRVGFWGTLFNSSSYRQEEKDKTRVAKEILYTLGLEEMMDQMGGNLSHGQQRALGIAMAMACNPKLLLMDEPASGLGLEEMHMIMQRIREIREKGITIILVEHEMRMVMSICDRIIVLNFGRKVAEGIPEQIKGNKEVIDAYLGHEQG